MKDDKIFLKLKIGKYEVEVKENKLVLLADLWYCAYVELPNSSKYSDEALNFPTFRKGDKVGVDTAHAHNENMTGAEKLADALRQISEIIDSYDELEK